MFAGFVCRGLRSRRRGVSWHEDPRGAEEPRIDFGYGGGVYIFPNEGYPEIWQPVLKDRKGVYISVGTFRVLNTAGYNDFSHTVMMDLDAVTSEFNRVNLELIDHGRTLTEYLSHLSGLAPKGEGRQNEWGDRLAEGYWKKFPSPLRENFQKHLVDSKLQSRIQNQRRDIGRWIRRNQFYDASGSYEHEAHFAKLEEHYQAIRRQVQAGRFTVVRGSVNGTQTLKAIAQALKAKHLKVSALDLSNVPDYFREDEKNPDGFKRFLENLEALPFEKDGQILFTHEQVGFPTTDTWSYNARLNKEFVSAARKYYEQHPRTGPIYGNGFFQEMTTEHGYRQLVPRHKHYSTPRPGENNPGMTVSAKDPCVEFLGDLFLGTEVRHK